MLRIHTINDYSNNASKVRRFSMRTIFNSCIPRDEVLSGELRDEMFAAKLKNVIDGKSDPIYQDPDVFFRNTFATQGLITLVSEVCGRLSGSKPDSNAFIRLETSFGGGKTHNLIALYHLAKGHSPDGVEGLVKPDLLPGSESSWAVAGIVGNDMDPTNGVIHGDITVRTIWGEIAWQIGGKSAYELIRSSDEQMVAPRTQILDTICGDKPTLIMLDELARHLRQGLAVPTANGKSNLADQTVSFLMALIDFAVSKPNVSVVLTLADSKDAFSTETEDIHQVFIESQRVSARQEFVLTPTGESEISKIVTHRLFKSIDSASAAEVASEYSNMFTDLERKGIDLPAKAQRAEYRSEIIDNYPFHPELLLTLNRKTSTIPNFQKTRGVLRLLARTVRDLWNRKPQNTWLVHLHDVNLAVPHIKEDLTSRLNKSVFKSVIDSDIVSTLTGSKAHSTLIDESLWLGSGKPAYACRIATSVLINSLTIDASSGIEQEELLLTTLTPGDDPEHIRRTLGVMMAEERIEAAMACWYLHFNGQKYRFKTEPSLEMMVQQELSGIGRTISKNAVDERIRSIWQSRHMQTVYRPEEAADLPDDSGKPKLAIIHYDSASTTSDSNEVSDLVSKLFTYSGVSQSYRTYKNNVLFLVADSSKITRMVDVMRRHLALERLIGNSDLQSDLNEEQRRRLQSMRDASDLNVRISITSTYKFLYYPSDQSRGGSGLKRFELQPQDQGKVNRDQSVVILEVLKQLDEVITADSLTIAPAYVKAKAWISNRDVMSTQDLHREFSKRPALKILLDVDQLKKTVLLGIKNNTWIYYDAETEKAYGKESPEAFVKFTENDFLYTEDKAKEVGIWPPKQPAPQPQNEICPLCNNSPCTCVSPGFETPTKKSDPDSFSEVASPAKAIQAIIDGCLDAGVKEVSWMSITVDDHAHNPAKDMKALGLALPQLPPGKYIVNLQLNIKYENNENFNVSFNGTVERYRKIRQSIENMTTDASDLSNSSMRITGHYDNKVNVQQALQSVREILTSMGVGTILVEAGK